ncbi:YqaE/Pmp3 family membrane protein [Sediminicola arcticus]|uniref:YqaE/Pmp3 family membrane protein n=1 Tax=Sediminicola arcticus TaxID=1574308 RepID=A0ABV2SS30_9FLAO
MHNYIKHLTSYFSLFLKHGVGSVLLFSILLTLIGWLTGVIYAFVAKL